MSQIQQYRITDLDSGFKCYFFSHSFMSGIEHARKYIKRNKGKFKMRLDYIDNIGPKYVKDGKVVNDRYQLIEVG